MTLKGTERYLKECDHRYVVVTEDHIWHSNTVILKEHKYRYVALPNSTHADGTNTLLMFAMLFSTTV